MRPPFFALDIHRSGPSYALPEPPPSTRHLRLRMKHPERPELPLTYPETPYSHSRSSLLTLLRISASANTAPLFSGPLPGLASTFLTFRTPHGVSTRHLQLPQALYDARYLLLPDLQHAVPLWTLRAVARPARSMGIAPDSIGRPSAMLGLRHCLRPRPCTLYCRLFSLRHCYVFCTLFYTFLSLFLFTFPISYNSHLQFAGP
jgi:hypothetical protein